MRRRSLGVAGVSVASKLLAYMSIDFRAGAAPVVRTCSRYVRCRTDGPRSIDAHADPGQNPPPDRTTPRPIVEKNMETLVEGRFFMMSHRRVTQYNRLHNCLVSTTRLICHWQYSVDVNCC